MNLSVTGDRMRCVLASSNVGKLREFDRLLGPLGWEVIAQSDLKIDSADEPYGTFLENALNKARHAARLSGLAALADDSGICVPALHGAPGVLSARYAQSISFVSETSNGVDHLNNQALLHQLRMRFGQVMTPAHFVCVLVFLRHADDPQPIVAQATWAGQVQEQPAGAGGFGYDPHFFVPAEGLTAAELSVDRKNQISHRARAMQRLLEELFSSGLMRSSTA